MIRAAAVLLLTLLIAPALRGRRRAAVEEGHRVVASFGLVLLVVAAFCGYRAFLHGRAVFAARAIREHTLGAARPTLPELVAMAEAARSALRGGLYAETVAVSGVVEVLDERTVAGPVSGGAAVWTRHQRVRRYRSDDRTVTETEFDRSNGVPFRLVADGAHVDVDPRDAQVDVRAGAVADRGPDPDDGVELGPLRFLGSTLGRSDQEWLVRPGERITVVGQARDLGGRVRIAAADGVPLLLAADEPAELVVRAGRAGQADLRRAVGNAVAAVVLVAAVIVANALF